MNIKALIAEFIGTFTLCFIGIGAIASNALAGPDGSSLLGVALAHGLAIAVMIASLGVVSGAHFNPAVTIGLLSAGKIDFLNAIGYVVAQVLAGIVAAALLLMLIPEQVQAVAMGAPQLAEGLPILSGIIIEVVLTFFLVFVIYGTAVDKNGYSVAALFIGFTIAIDILMGGPFTGAAMNPARQFGPALFAGGAAASQIWLYWLAPVVGGVLASQTYKYIFED